MSSQAIEALLGSKRENERFNCSANSITDIIELIKYIRSTPDKQLDILTQLLERPSTLPAPTPTDPKLHVCCCCRCGH